MATVTEQRGLYMTPGQWARLEEVAAATKSIARSGPQARQPSWRTLITRIADGEVIMVEREPYVIPADLEEAVRLVEERQREEERQVEHRQRIETHTRQKAVIVKKPLKMEQLHMLELEPA